VRCRACSPAYAPRPRWVRSCACSPTATTANSPPWHAGYCPPWLGTHRCCPAQTSSSTSTSTTRSSAPTVTPSRARATATARSKA
jgi:hypothetical protein